MQFAAGFACTRSTFRANLSAPSVASFVAYEEAKKCGKYDESRNTSLCITGLKLSSMFSISNPLPSNQHKPVALVGLDYDDMIILADQYMKEYNLDPNQASVLRNVAEVLRDHGKSISPITLLDGVAGSGKTFLLCLSILFLHEVLHSSPTNEESSSRSRKRWKVLVTASTDAQIDIVITSLLRLSFDSFVRVGDLEAIKPSLLPYSVHCKGGSSEQIKKLKSLLRQTVSNHDKQSIKKSIELVESGATKRLLHKAFVVGVTCRASSAPCLGYYKFPFVIIDNAHTIGECHSLLPLVSSSCEKLLLAGDHCLQLSNHNLPRSLFQRLIEADHETILLRNQYRAHPLVTSLLNRVLYGDVINDVTDERRGVIEGLPHLCMYDVPGKAEQKSPGDFVNMEEVKLIADVITYLLSNGVPGSCMVVVTTFDAQADAIQSQLRELDLHDMSDVECVEVTAHAHYDGAERKILLFAVGLASDRYDVIKLMSCATHHVIIVGNVNSLSNDTMWRNVVEFLRGASNGLSTAFQFRKMLDAFLSKLEANRMKVMTSRCEEAELPDENFNSTMLPTENSYQSDSDLNSNESLNCNVIGEGDFDDATTQDAADDESSNMTYDDVINNDDDLPLLCHNKRKRFLIEDDDSISESSQIT